MRPDRTIAAIFLCYVLFVQSGRSNASRQRNRTPGRHANNGFGENCDLRGAWYNQLGSELYLNQTENGHLHGEYRTAVRLASLSDQQEANTGEDAQSTFAQVKGTVSGRVFTFHVFWTEKKAVTTWTGQCLRSCDFGWHQSAGDVLQATWIITSAVSSCDDYWMANRIGNDLFTRQALKTGPRRSQASAA